MFAAAVLSAWLPRAARAFAIAGLLVFGALRAWAADEAPRFDILEYVVEGNTVLEVPAIEAALLPHLGPGRTMADVEAARAALEKAYQGGGYLTVFVDVPEQRVDGGLVRLAVLEGRVERLSVTGSRYFSQGYIRAKVAELETGRVPNFNEVQRQLAVVNRSDERRVQPVLRPGRLPGTVDVELKVSDELPLQGRIELHNDHGADTDPWRLSATLGWDNLFQRDHAVSLTANVAPREPDQSQSLVLNYSVPRDGGDQVVAYLAASNSAIETLGSTTVLGDGLTLGLRYVKPFSGPGGSFHSFSFGADLKHLDEQISFADETVTSTPLRYLPLQAAYNGNWSGGGSQTQLSTTLVAAFRKLLERTVTCPLADGEVAQVDQFACKRRNASGTFAALRVDLRHTEGFGWGALALRLAGQASTHLLPSGEQFSLGGSDSVRGYLEGESVGDHGLLGSLELRSANLAPRLVGATEGTPWLRDLSVHGFVDAGRSTVFEPLPGQAARVPLLGTGVGLRLAAGSALNAALDLAVPHKRTRATAEGDTRLHVRLALRF